MRIFLLRKIAKLSWLLDITKKEEGGGEGGRGKERKKEKNFTIKSNYFDWYKKGYTNDLCIIRFIIRSMEKEKRKKKKKFEYKNEKLI